MPSRRKNQRKKTKQSAGSGSKATKTTIPKQSVIISLLYGCIEIIFSIIGIIIIGIFYETVWNNSPSAPLIEPITKDTIPKIYNIYDENITTIVWKDVEGETNLDKMLNIGRSRTPTLIKKSPSTYWKANRQWKLSDTPQKTIKYLTKLHYDNHRNISDIKTPYDINDDIISVFRMNNTNFFTFMDKSRPFVNYEMVNDTNYNLNDIERLHVSLHDFLTYINNKKYSNLNVNNSYLYYLDSAKNVYQDLKPITWFKMRDKTVAFSDKHIRKLLDINNIYLDISPSKLFINAYYDMTHNFFYQIEGQRRFLISPPSETPKFHSFPEGHPSFRSSQISYKFYFIPFNLWISRKSHPFTPFGTKQSDNINAWNVNLEPGDLLYIPPFYWTQITTLQNSIAIKSSSLGFEQIFSSLSDPRMLPKVLHSPYLDDIDKQKWLLHQLAFFTRQLIDRILKSLPDKRDIIETNKKELLNEYNDELEWDVIHKWIKIQLIDTRYKGNLLWDDMQCTYFDAVRCPLHGNTTTGLMQTMEQNAKTWALAYKELKQYVDNEDDVYWIRNIMLATHIEQFVSFITGHDNYCYFIQCLVHERFGSLYVESKEEEMRRRMEADQNM